MLRSLTSISKTKRTRTWRFSLTNLLSFNQKVAAVRILTTEDNTTDPQKKRRRPTMAKQEKKTACTHAVGMGPLQEDLQEDSLVFRSSGLRKSEISGL